MCLRDGLCLASGASPSACPGYRYWPGLAWPGRIRCHKGLESLLFYFCGYCFIDFFLAIEFLFASLLLTICLSWRMVLTLLCNQGLGQASHCICLDCPFGVRGILLGTFLIFSKTPPDLAFFLPHLSPLLCISHYSPTSFPLLIY